MNLFSTLDISAELGRGRASVILISDRLKLNPMRLKNGSRLYSEEERQAIISFFHSDEFKTSRPNPVSN